MNNITHTLEERKHLFISKSKIFHGETYDYSKVSYKTAREKVEIICSIHGSFFQIPDSHSSGRGCPSCGFIKSKPKSFSIRKSGESFIEECKKVHSGFYLYDLTTYTGKVNNIDITCPLHGVFSQKAENHRNGMGCPSCGTERARIGFKNDLSKFVEISRKVHGDKYDYSKSVYSDNKSPISIICKEHGDFTISRAMYHYIGSCMGCPKCTNTGISILETEIFEYIVSLGVEATQRDRSIIQPLELDIVIPAKKIAIEFNGLFWHSEEAGKNSSYHLNKTLKAKSAGYRLIHIFEDEWVNKPNIVKSRLAHILGIDTEPKYFARKLNIRNPSRGEVKDFQEVTHIQGFCTHAVAYGLYDDNNLVACMTFGKNRFTKEGGVELIRYSTKGNVVGGFSRLLKAFSRDFKDVKEITSYSDRRWSEGNVYLKNGFSHDGSSNPSYFYIDTKKIERLNRIGFQKHKLSNILEKFNPLISEVENMKLNKYYRIFDCGTDRWILNTEAKNIKGEGQDASRK